jgi:hypothetical protein
MRYLASSIAMSLILANDAHSDDLRRADQWRKLHRRQDAKPDFEEGVEPVRPYRRFRVSEFIVRRRDPLAGEG